jgi:glycosyltransferase involved in cell wall biosynthesis
MASIPEICGPAVEYFDPYSAEDIARGVERTISDQALRERLRAAGRERVTHYSWDVATSQVADVMRQVATG